MAITRRIVEALGGTITCESELGDGSLFSLILPLPTAQAAPTSVCAAEPALIPSVRLLVVEDNDINRELLQQILQQQGHQVTVASGGAEAVEICRQQAFDLILMDISRLKWTESRQSGAFVWRVWPKGAILSPSRPTQHPRTTRGS
nr:response regulator [Pseudophaeobacter leonis]